MTITPAGKRRSQIQILQRDSERDAAGQPVNIWTTFATTWARVVSTTGSENFKADQFSPEVTHVAYIQWIPGLLPMMAILTPDGIYLDILSVNYGERNLDDTVITCKQRVGVNNPT